jgi:pilus assembly protein CpaE
MSRRRRERGQAGVELLALLPLLLLVALGAAQMLAVGYSSVLAGNAAEAAALAIAGGRDPHAAAREALPGWSRDRVDVSVRGGDVRVRLRPPGLFPAIGRDLRVTATAAVEAP